MEQMVITAVLAFLFAGFRELSEHGKEGAFVGYPDWWNTPKASQNKYNWNGRLPEWVFSSILVWTTDAEHFFQMMSLLCVLSIIYVLGGWQLALTAYFAQALFGFLKSFTSIK